jgi:hypothetical protein
MHPNHFVANFIPPSGYSWTLPSRLGELLAAAETAYGSRDSSYTILGVEFGPGTPQVWYPGDRKHVVVQLAMNAIINHLQAYYQLAHECVHLLAPSGGRGCPVLEEGVATVFSEDCTKRAYGIDIPAGLPSYASAAALTRRLLERDPEAIKKLRSKSPSFFTMTPAHFEELFPGIDPLFVGELLATFVRE